MNDGFENMGYYGIDTFGCSQASINLLLQLLLQPLLQPLLPQCPHHQVLRHPMHAIYIKQGISAVCAVAPFMRNANKLIHRPHLF